MMNSTHQEIEIHGKWARTQRIGQWSFALSLGSICILSVWSLMGESLLGSQYFFVGTLTLSAACAGCIVLFSLLLKVQFERMKQRLLDQSNRLLAKNEQISHVAFTTRHDLRGALDGMVFSTDLLREQLAEMGAGHSTLHEVADMMSMEIEQQCQLLDSLKEWLEMVREEEVSREEVDLEELLTEIESEVCQKAHIARGPLPHLHVCRSKFRSALARLIENSIMHNTHTVPEVYVYNQGNTIVVEDNGCGFESARFDQLCQPFQRLSEHGRGSGMGLAIVRGICNNHGFQLSAESTPGKGSRVMIQYS